MTLFTDVNDVVYEGEEAYAQGLHAAIVAAYGKTGDLNISEQKRVAAATLLFDGSTSTLARLLKESHKLSDMELIVVDAMLRDMISEFPIFEETITQAIATIEKQLVDRGASVSGFMNDMEDKLKDPTTKEGEQVNNMFNSYDNFADKVDKISVDVGKYKESTKDELTRDAAERFLTQNFGKDEGVTKKMTELKGSGMEDLVKLSLLAFAKAQADKNIEPGKLAQIEVSFISLLIQPSTKGTLEKISTSDDLLAGWFSVSDMKQIAESAKTFLVALNDVLDKNTETEKTGLDLSTPTILEKLQLDNPAFGKAYDLFKSDCRSVIEGEKE